MQLHRTIRCALLAGLLEGLGVVSSYGQFTFQSGSDGTYGPMNITNNTTLALPSDGIFRCTTITVASNATLTFTPNALNTPVYLLATNDVTINGTIDVSGSLGTAWFGGAGGPGGFAGGNPPWGGILPAGDGHGPGAGRAGSSDTVGPAGYGTGGYGSSIPTNNGTTYGSPLLIPLVGGSGGGGSSDDQGGAGGGGAILIACNTRIDLSGTILAWSPDSYGHFGFGSGGAIRLAAPIVAGAGTLNARGGYLDPFAQSSGGAGRIRIDSMDHRWLALNCTPAASIGANMVAIPASLPRLDITQVGANNIPVGTIAPVFFYLAQGSSTNQIVTVQASNFGASVPIRVMLTPDNGPGSSYDSQIDNSTVNPASVTVPVVVPVNVQVQVSAWSR